MDYEKKYKEALNWMKDVYPTLEGAAKEDAEHYFPELKESEDEGIRKALIEAIRHNYVLTGSINHIPTKDILAWLEKQGEQKPIDKIQLGKKYKCIASPRYSTFMIGEIYKPEDKFLCSLMNFCSDCFEPIEEDDQKHTDKVEPKFKVGDWVIGRATENEPRQIAEITEEGYKTTYGGWIGFSFEEDMRLWTIKDAKDGDVLCFEQIILLFKKWENNSYWNCVIAYAGIDITGKLQITNEHWLVSNYAHPATKEERELLFAKMKEAGYEWSSEEKKLKKVEKKPTWSEEDIATISRVISIVKWAAYSDHSHPILNDEGATELVERLKSLKGKVLPKQEWSEEDEKMYNRIFDLIHAAAFANYEVDEDGKECGEYAKIIGWFKFLKDQHTWKVSDLQIEALESAAQNCAYSEYKDCLRELIGQLKKLREE